MGDGPRELGFRGMQCGGGRGARPSWWQERGLRLCVPRTRTALGDEGIAVRCLSPGWGRPSPPNREVVGFGTEQVSVVTGVLSAVNEGWRRSGRKEEASATGLAAGGERGRAYGSFGSNEAPLGSC